MNLAADVASTIRLGCFGHDLTLDVRPIAAWLDTLTTDELRRRRAGLPQLFGEAHVDALVEEILQDESVNVSYVPDVVGRCVSIFLRRMDGAVTFEFHAGRATFTGASSASHLWFLACPGLCRFLCWTSTGTWRCGVSSEQGRGTLGDSRGRSRIS